MQITCSNKPIVQQLIKACLKFNAKHVVISPGSRNAPLTISFTQIPAFNCYSIPDERSAAFYALGMAKQLNKPVVLICTSGSAALNYAPAIAEAYYQEIPLIVVSADRPPEWIDQEDGQTIRQENIYNNYIGYSASLPKGINANELESAEHSIEKAFSTALANKKSPVHINVPFDEPLYETQTIALENKQVSTIDISSDDNNIEADTLDLVQACQKANKIMILAGVMQPNALLNETLNRISDEKNIVVVAPPYSNLKGAQIIQIPELIYNTISDEEKEKLRPDLLITIGGPVVSKATKIFLRKYKADVHIDIDYNEQFIDTYLSLTSKIINEPNKVLNHLSNCIDAKDNSFITDYLSLQTNRINKTDQYTESLELCDLSFYKILFQSLKQSCDIHFANSTPIRYSELFKSNINLNYYCNRGTSGIDGNNSIAAGAALVSEKPTLLITGEISFGYDSNAFWNNHVPNNLKIIVINNGGGNIFRVISGPEQSKSLPFFETKIEKSIDYFCKSYGLKYLSAKNLTMLESSLQELYESETCTILEVFTPAQESAEQYRNLFRELRK